MPFSSNPEYKNMKSGENHCTASCLFYNIYQLQMFKCLLLSKQRKKKPQTLNSKAGKWLILIAGSPMQKKGSCSFQLSQPI